jgi:hypothetical protein
MSFLLDPPMLYATGEAWARAPESAQGRQAAVAGAATVAAYWAVSGSLWLERPWVAPLWKAFGAKGGRDFMAGSGLFHPKGVKRPGTRAHALAAAGLATYPLWFWLGWDHGRRRRG